MSEETSAAAAGDALGAADVCAIAALPNIKADDAVAQKSPVRTVVARKCIIIFPSRLQQCVSLCGHPDLDHVATDFIGNYTDVQRIIVPPYISAARITANRSALAALILGSGPIKSLAVMGMG